MRGFLKTSAVPLALLAIKLLTTWRTAVDTFSVTHDWLDVILIDGVMLAFWLVTAYAGENQTAMSIRPFTAIGAWALYLSQLYIGWEATHTGVAFIVRGAGGLALLYDTWDYVAALTRKQARRRRSIREKRASQRLFVMNIGYLFFVLVGTPVWWLVSGVSVVADFARDAGLIIRPAKHVSAVSRLDTVDIIDGEAVNPERQLTSGTVSGVTSALSTTDRRRQIERQVDTDPNVTVTQLAVKYNVSRGTIYNDLNSLGITLTQK